MPQRFFCAVGSNSFTVCGKGPDGILSVVVVPGDAVVAHKREEFLPVLPKSLPKFLSRLRLKILTCHPRQKLANGRLMLGQKTCRQTALVDGLHNRLQHAGKPTGNLPQF